jgi:ankyrin repeat protein
MLAAIKQAVEDGNNVNEVEASGNTPMHAAAYEGWVEGGELLLSLGAKIDASNNAGDRPYHTAAYLNNKDFMSFLEAVSAAGDICTVLLFNLIHLIVSKGLQEILLSVWCRFLRMERRRSEARSLCLTTSRK